MSKLNADDMKLCYATQSGADCNQLQSCINGLLGLSRFGNLTHLIENEGMQSLPSILCPFCSAKNYYLDVHPLPSVKPVKDVRPNLQFSHQISTLVATFCWSKFGTLEHRK